MLHKLASKPKRLFLIDSLGAFLTAFLLSTILPIWQQEFGMPQRVLLPLSIVAFVYALYSACCYFFVQKRWQLFLKIIAIANLLYCCVTILIVIVFFRDLTILGFTYFVVESIVIASLVYVEVFTISKSTPSNN